MRPTWTLLLLGCLLMASQSPPETSELGIDPTQVKEAVLALAGDTDLAQAFVGFDLVEVASGNHVYSYNADKAFRMASVMKLYSTAYALDVLGPAFTFSTKLGYSGTIRDSVLYGNLVVQGSGDPSLGSTRWLSKTAYENIMQQFVEAVEKLDIRRIKGHVWVDDSRYSPNATPAGWVWEDLGNYYGAPCYGFNILDNTYSLSFTPTVVGDTAWILDTDPDVYELDFLGAILTDKPGTGDQAYINGSPYDTLRFLHGSIPDGGEFTIRGSLPYPPLFFAKRLTAALALRGILTTEPPQAAGLAPAYTSRPVMDSLLVNQVSPPLNDLATLTNFWSINLFAEGLLRAAAYEQAKSYEHADAAWNMTSYFRKKGVETKGLRAADGSGLSQLSQATPGNLTSLLRVMKSSTAFEPYYASLARAGSEGISRHLKVSGPNILRLKGGSFTGAASFAGYVLTPEGKLYAFCLVTNGFQMSYSCVRDKMTKVLQVLAQGG